MCQDSDSEKLLELINCLQPQLNAILGSDYKKKSVRTLIKEGYKEAEEIIGILNDFSKPNTFPEFYNPRAVHAMFSKAFLFISVYYEVFVTIVRSQGYENFKFGRFSDRCDFILYMLEGLKVYDYMSSFCSSTVRYYGDISQSFKDLHANTGFNSFIQDQLILCIDISNPTGHILNELKRYIEDAKTMFKTRFKEVFEQFAQNLGNDFPDIKVPNIVTSFGDPLVDETGKTTSRQETVLPEWHEAFRVYRIAQDGGKEAEIIQKIYGETRDSHSFPGRKKTVHDRKKLAERLMDASFYGRPLSWHHRGQS